MKKISFLMCSMGRGGAERVVSILSKYYCGLGWNVDICMILHDINEYELDERVNVLNLSCETLSGIKKWKETVLKLREYLKEQKPDVIVPFLAKTSAVFGLAQMGLDLSSCRVVSSERIDPYSVRYPLPLRLLVNYSYRRADAVVFQTKRAMSYYGRSIRKKGVIIGNPIEAEFHPESDGTHTIISAGRLTPQKNHAMLIRAFAGVSRDFPDYVLHIYGEGKMRDELQALIEKLGMENRVFLKGNQSDYKERLKNAEMFILSSNFEGLSNALLEAMLMGKPCISTSCAGSDEVIVNYLNGVLVPVGDTNAMEKAIVTLLENEKLKVAIGENAAKLRGRFSTENVIGQWRKVFEK